MFEGEFTVPEYYEKFRCKGSECRCCCCGGWNITVSMREYFTLLGIDCSDGLRKKIDCALHVLHDADPDRYAVISLSYTGECPLRREEDGYCSLQCECGEEHLPSVCRYYPRSPRLYPYPECCISNSCEKVIEDLIATEEPLKFKKINLKFHFDDDEPIIHAADNYFYMRNLCADILTDRTKGITERIIRIAEALGVDTHCGIFTEQGTEELISDLTDIYMDSPSLSGYCREMQQNKSSFSDIKRAVYSMYPKFDLYAEKILANHFFFMKVPFSGQSKNTEEEGIAIYALVIFGIKMLGACADGDINKFVDVTGKLFRVAEHTNFYKNAVVIAKTIIKNKNAL